MKRRYTFFSALLWLSLFCSTGLFAGAQESAPKAAKSVSYNTGTYFIENKGQWNDSVRYLTRRNGMDMWVLPRAFVYDVYKLRPVTGPKTIQDPLPNTDFEREGHVFRMNFLGAASTTDRGMEPRAEYHNYFLGNNPEKWASHVPLYNTIELEQLYPGINAVVYDDNGSPRYDLVVQPQADPAAITINIDGAKSWRIDESGNLLIETSVGTMTHGKLFAYQTHGDTKQPVECKFETRVVGTEEVLTFALGAYDHTRPLVIDPLIYSTYIGGSNPGNTYDVATGVQVDAAGYAYVTGYSNATGFPAISGSYRTYPAGGGTGYNAFVAKVYPNGDDLEYLTVLGGGAGSDVARDIAIDFSGNSYITGYTNSSTFPTLNAYDAGYNGGDWDVFVTKLNSDGTLTGSAYSTYLGGDATDKAYAIYVESGSAYITGYSNSTTASYPVTVGAFDMVSDGFGDAILTKLSPTGNTLVYSTFIGSAPNATTPVIFDCGFDIVVSASGEPYITGITGGAFPVLIGAYDASFNICTVCTNYIDNLDVFVIHFASDGTTRVGSTYFGGNRPDYGSGIAIDNSGNIYIIGTTMSDATIDGFPISTGAYQPTSNLDGSVTTGDAFIARFNGALTNLSYSTYLSGPDVPARKDYGYKIALEQSSGTTHVYAVGATESAGFPVKPNPGAYMTTNRGQYDVFITKLQLNGTGTNDLLYSTYFGGQANDGFIDANFDDYSATPNIGLAHTVTPSGIITLAGPTASNRSGSDPFPISPDAWDDSFSSSMDGFVTRFQVDIDYIKILSPTTASRTAFCQGNTVNISWTHSFGISRVIVELLNSSGNVQQQLSDQVTPPQFYLWQIPDNFPAGDYTIRIRDYANNDLETSATITIRALPSITDQPDDVTICNDNSTPITLSVTATGTNIAYQWYQAPSSLLPGETSATLSLGVARSALNGNQYYVKVSNVCAEVTSSTVTIRIIEPPTVTGPSITAIELCEGNSTTLTVTTAGTSVAISWEYQLGSSAWTTLPGETGATLQLNNIPRAWNGRKYRARVIDPIYNCGNGVSGTVTLTVNWAPEIAPPGPSPVLNPICEGGTFSIRGLVIDASPQETIEWQISDVNGNDVSSTVLASNTAVNPAELELVNVPLTWNGYRIFARVWNVCNSATTATITLNVLAKPRIESITPATLTICEDLEAKFEVQATGATLQYQWYKVGTGLLSGKTTKELIINPVTLNDAGEYYVEVSGACSPPVATTTHVFLIVQAKPRITAQPAPAYELICTGATHTITATATGTNATYQWQKYNDVSGVFENLIGEINSTLTIINVQVINAGRYRLVVSGTCPPPAISDEAVLDVGIAPSITKQPIDSTVCENTPASFSADATGVPDPTVRWFIKASSGADQPISDGTGSPSFSGAQTTQLQVSDINFSHDGMQFYAVFSNICGDSATQVATLHVNKKPSISESDQPEDVTVCADSTAIFTANAQGIPAPEIQWMVDNGDGNGFRPVNESEPTPSYSGSRTSTLVIEHTTINQDGYRYQAVFTNACGSTVSSIAVLTVKTRITILNGPTAAVKCVGESVVFHVEATGSNLTYTWRRKNTMDTIARGPDILSYAIDSVTINDADTYEVIVSGYCDEITTSATLVVNEPPAISIYPVDDTVCEGESVEFTVVATGATLSYQWYRGIDTLRDEIRPTLSLSNVTTGTAGVYRVEISGACSPATSASVVLTVNTAPTITNQPVSRSACEGTSTLFSVGATGTALQYQWRKNGDEIPNANSSQLPLDNITQADAGQYDVIITGACGEPVISTRATLTVNTAPKITLEPLSQIICEGETLQLVVEATGAGRIFQWRKDGVPIPAPEGTSQTYTVTSVTDAANGVYDVIVSGTCTPPAPPDTSAPATIRVQLPPQISNTPPFPAVQCPGGTSRDTLVITNPGEATLSMNGITISSLRFTVIEPIGPFDIPPMSSRNVIIEFRPIRAGIENASVNFTTVQCNTQILSPISAKADSVRITSLPEVQFKSVAQCDGPDVQEVLVENTGDVEVSVTPFFSDPRFALDNPADNPFVVPAGGSRRIRVRFTSNGIPDNNITANVRFRADHCNYETITVLQAKSIRVAYEAIIPGGTLDFGTLAGCQTNITRQFPIRNIGNAPVTITSATTTNPAFGVTLPQNPLVLQVGSTATVTVQFGSGPAGPVTGKLILRSGTPCPQDTTFDLVGNRGNVAISSDIQALTFPKLLSCNETTADTVIVITNNGTEDASFGASTIAAPFSIEDIQPGPSSFPRIVQAGASIRVRVAYKPTSEGDHGQTINFPFTWGACSDTLRIQVAGSFVTPKLEANITTIDFGALLGCDGTVDTTITLTNPGREDLSISDITDPTGYTIKALLPTSLPLQIPAGDSAKIRIRFAPPAPGVYNTTFTLVAEPCDVTINITLRGSKQGVSFTDIPGDVVDFGYVVACSTDNISPQSFTITNTSDGDIEGTVSYTISGPFETNLQQNTQLPKGTPVPFNISFKPTGKGQATGELRLVYEPCGITRIITLKGIVTDVQLANNGTLIFPDETVGNTSAIRTVSFTNAGSTTLTIENISNLAAPFSVVSVTPPLPATLNPGETLRVGVTFTPDADGDFSGVLRIESNTPCPIFSEVAIEGRGTNAPQPNITFTGLDFEEVYVNMSKTMKVTIVNDGFDDGNVYDITSDNPQFVVQSLTYPIQVAKEGGSFQVDVTFTPTSPGPHQAKLRVMSDGGSPEGTLKGIGIPLPIGQTTLAMPALTAEAGTSGFAIPIRLDQQQNLDETEAITSLTFDVSFNSTLFYPTSVSRGQIIDNTFDPDTHVRTVTIQLSASDFTGIPEGGNVLTEMIGDVLLGNSESTPLTFSNIDWEVQLGDADALMVHGSLTLTNVCRVGGARLIKLNKAFGITAMSPNPASDQVEVIVEVPGNGEASLEIYSLTGERVYDNHWTVAQNKELGTASTTNRTFIIRTSELPSGVYQVMLRSRERLDTQRLLIVK